jgi:hypothetical protein
MGTKPGVPERKVMSPEVHAFGLTPFGIETPPADCANLIIEPYQLGAVVISLEATTGP